MTVKVRTKYRSQEYQIFNPAMIGDDLTVVTCPNCKTRVECEVDLFAASSDGLLLAAADCRCGFMSPAVLIDLKEVVKPAGAHIGWQRVREPIIPE